jgi:hypothetical protein
MGSTQSDKSQNDKSQDDRAQNDKLQNDKSQRSSARACAGVVLLSCGFVVLGFGRVSAQSIDLSAPDPKRWDVTGSIGWLGGNKSDLAEDWNDWYDTFAASLDVGRYWTPHFKTEAGVTFTTDGTVFSHEERLIPDERASIFVPREHTFRLTALSAAATYQFLENTWVHPFLSGGVQFVQERERAFSHDVPYFRRDFTRIDVPIPPPVQATVLSVRPFAMGGAKFYVNERGFIRSDLSVAWHDGRAGHVTWRAGIGVDF